MSTVKRRLQAPYLIGLCRKAMLDDFVDLQNAMLYADGAPQGLYLSTSKRPGRCSMSWGKDHERSGSGLLRGHRHTGKMSVA
jgi:hypothetical protein